MKACTRWGEVSKNVWPDKVHKMNKSVLAAEAKDSERHVFDGGTGSLSVNQVSVHQGILEERCDRIDVVLPHLTDVLEEEGERLEDAVLNVELWHPVLIHETGEHRERRTGLRHDGDGDSGAHAILSLLHLQVVEERGEHIMRTDGLGDVSEGVHCGSANGLLVGFQQLQQFKTDSHPFTSRNILRPSISNSTHKIDAVLLNFLVPVLQDGSEAGQEVLDRRRHLRHSYNINDSFQCS